MLIALKDQRAKQQYNRQYEMIYGIMENMELSHIINNLHSGPKTPQYPGVPLQSMVLANLFFHYLHKNYKKKISLAHLQVY